MFVAVDKNDNMYIADANNNRIRFVDKATGIVSTIVGDGYTDSNFNGRYNGDGIAATSASLFNPIGILLDSSDNIYIADRFNNRIRLVIRDTSIISTVAGMGPSGGFCKGGYNGDGITATSASLNSPLSIALDKSNNVFISDECNHRIRFVQRTNGLITTVAGTGYRSGGVYGGYNDDGLAATSAFLNLPSGIVLDKNDNIYFADVANNRVRLVDMTTGIISTVIGTGVQGYNGDRRTATSADINWPYFIALDVNGNIYFSDYGNQRIRLVNITTRIIYDIVGTGARGFNGDNIFASSAEINYPCGVALDSSNNLIISDNNNQRIRFIQVRILYVITVSCM